MIHNILRLPEPVFSKMLWITRLRGPLSGGGGRERRPRRRLGGSPRPSVTRDGHRAASSIPEIEWQCREIPVRPASRELARRNLPTLSYSTNEGRRPLSVGLGEKRACREGQSEILTGCEGAANDFPVNSLIRRLNSLLRRVGNLAERANEFSGL